MSYGLIVRNESNFIQIDDSYRNYMLSVSGSASTNSSGEAFIGIPNDGYAPLVYIKIPFGSNLVLAEVSTGTLYVRVSNASGAAVGGYGFQYRVYSRTMPASADSYGIKIRNGSSQVVFDSGYTYPRIRSVTNLHPWVGTSAALREVYYSVSDPWFQVMPSWLHTHSWSNDYEEIYLMVYRHNGVGSLTVGSVAYIWDAYSWFPYYTGILRPAGTPTVPASVGYMGSIIQG